MDTQEMMATSKILEEVQKGMATRYDAEYNEIKYFVGEAYAQGIEDGRASAKQEIIDMISTEKN